MLVAKQNERTTRTQGQKRPADVIGNAAGEGSVERLRAA